MRAAAIAAADHDRAVTHNKGVLNGIAALTQATGNDTRAVEAAAHGWAAAGAGYAPLTGYHVANGALHCRLQCPLPLGTVGGAVGVLPVSRLALRILGNPDSRRLAAVAAAVGLAQNLAALRLDQRARLRSSVVSATNRNVEFTDSLARAQPLERPQVARDRSSAMLMPLSIGRRNPSSNPTDPTVLPSATSTTPKALRNSRNPAACMTVRAEFAFPAHCRARQSGAIGCFRPYGVGTRRFRLMGSKIRRVHGSLDEVLGRHRRPGQTAKHGELSGVGHGVGERTLQQSFFGRPPQLGASHEMPPQVLDHRVEAHDFSSEIGQWFGSVAAAFEERARVTEHARHVPNETGGCSRPLANLEHTKEFRRPPKRFLRTVGERCEKMPQHGSFVIHAAPRVSVYRSTAEVSSSDA